MILLTIGTQLPFDRLVRTVDALAPRLGFAVTAQIGQGAYRPKNMPFCPSFMPDAFNAQFAAASLIVSHAGIGTVLTAQRMRKPIILFPRRAHLGEHRNDHQMATCRHLEGRAGIHIAWDEQMLQRLLLTPDLPFANDDDLAATRSQFIDNLRALLVG